MRKERLALAFVVTVLLNWSSSARAQYAYPPPPYPYAPPPYAYPYAPAPGGPPAGYHYEDHPRRGLIIGGAVLFGLSYAGAVTTGAVYQDWKLMIPIGGSFWEARDDFAAGGMVADAIGAAFVLDGVLQASGLIMMIAGGASHQRVLVHDHYAAAPAIKVTCAPHLSPRFSGLSLAVHF